jgi:hypothetical protein
MRIEGHCRVYFGILNAHSQQPLLPSNHEQHAEAKTKDLSQWLRSIFTLPVIYSTDESKQLPQSIFGKA